MLTVHLCVCIIILQLYGITWVQKDTLLVGGSQRNVVQVINTEYDAVSCWHSMCKALTGLPIGYSVIVALTGLPIGYSVIVALTGLPIGHSVIVVLTGLPIGYSVIVALTGLPIGYSVIVGYVSVMIDIQSSCPSGTWRDQSLIQWSL